MIIEVNHLSFSYGIRPVLSDIHFCIEESTFLSVLGANGVGKSTLFRCLLAIIKNYQGEINFDGREIRSMTQKKRASLIAYIPQIHRPHFGYSALDTVLMGTGHRFSIFSSPRRQHVDQAMRAMERLGISRLAGRNYSRLSGGEQQLVLIARALAQEANVLIMDEPTSSLDFGNQIMVLNQIKQLTSEGYMVIVSTHNPQHALTFSDRVLALKEGRILAYGNTDDCLTVDLIQDLYGITCQMINTDLGRTFLPNIFTDEERR